MWVFNQILVTMELIEDCSSSHRDDKVEPGNLLEQYWFFGNLLIDSKPKISRSNSDHCPSSSYNSQEDMLITSDQKSSPSTKKHPKLVRTPSLPSSMDRAVDIAQEKQSWLNSGGRKSNQRNNLIRPSSLPPCIGKEEEEEEEEDQESEFTLGRLIRQASLNSSDMLPPKQTSKRSSIPKKICPRKKPDELERLNMEGCKEMVHQYLTNQAKNRRSSDIQTKEVEGFKAFSLEVEKQGVANKFPSLQEKGSWLKLNEKMTARRPSNLSEAWNVKSSPPSIPKCAAAVADNDKKLAQDMKAQIKFWARAVASNVKRTELFVNRFGSSSI